MRLKASGGSRLIPRPWGAASRGRAGRWCMIPVLGGLGASRESAGARSRRRDGIPRRGHVEAVQRELQDNGIPRGGKLVARQPARPARRLR
eukprot:9172584-Heterocapsa_arctica.AAC.1